MNSVKHALELISIHIPKTAGTSFQQILEAQYPGKALLRLDFEFVRDQDETGILRAKNKTDQRVLDGLVKEGEIPEYVKAIHGHFTLQDIQQLLGNIQTVRLVTWLREPIERVISNYNYLNELLESEVRDRPQAQRLMNRLKRSIYEFAVLPANTNKYRIYLGGQSLEPFDFVGLTDSFDEDIQHLADLMGWQTPDVYHVNRTPRKAHGFTAEEQTSLESLYSHDIHIYRSAVELRQARIN